jgi:hypothetical protein
MVPQIAIRLATRGFAALIRDDLRRAGLSGDVAPGNPRTAGRPGAVDGEPQAVPQRVERLGLERDAIGHGVRRHRLPAVAFVDRLDHAWRDPRAAVGHG